MALNFKNYKLARYLVRFLSNKDKPWAQILLQVHLKPKNSGHFNSAEPQDGDPSPTNI